MDVQFLTILTPNELPFFEGIAECLTLLSGNDSG